MLTDEFAEVNGVRLHYVTAGSGKLLIFPHGFPEFWYAWKNPLQEFCRDYWAVAPDLRGYNLSSKPAALEAYRVKHLIEDVRALARRLTSETFILAGHDWGGVIAWGYALAHPEDLDKLIIVNAPHPVIFERELRTNPAQRRASLYMLLFRLPGSELLLRAFGFHYLVERVIAPGLRRGYFSEEDRKAYLAAWSEPGALKAGLNYYRAARVGPLFGARRLADRNLDIRSSVVRVPTLVIWGERDRYLLTGNLDGLEEFVPQLSVRRVSDGSHWIVHEKPALVNQLIREFIR